MGQRLQMKMPVDDQLRARQLRGQIIFPPEVQPGTGEHSLGVCAIAVEFARQSDNAFNIGAGAFFSLPSLLSSLRRASRARSLIRIVSSLCALLRGVAG